MQKKKKKRKERKKERKKDECPAEEEAFPLFCLSVFPSARRILLSASARARVSNQLAIIWAEVYWPHPRAILSYRSLSYNIAIARGEGASKLEQLALFLCHPLPPSVASTSSSRVLFLTTQNSPPCSFPRNSPMSPVPGNWIFLLLLVLPLPSPSPEPRSLAGVLSTGHGRRKGN